MADRKRADNPIDAITGIIDTYTKMKVEKNKLQGKLMTERVKRKDQMMDYIAKRKFSSEQTLGRQKTMYEYKRDFPMPPKTTAAQQKYQRVAREEVPDIDESQLRTAPTGALWWRKKGKAIAPEVIKISQGIRTVNDLSDFLNNVGPYKKKYGEESVNALFDYIDENIIPYLTVEQQQLLKKKGYFE